MSPALWLLLPILLVPAGILLLGQSGGRSGAADLEGFFDGVPGVTDAQVTVDSGLGGPELITATVTLDPLTADGLTGVMAAWDELDSAGPFDPESLLRVTWEPQRASSFVALVGWGIVPDAAASAALAEMWLAEDMASFQVHLTERSYLLFADLEPDVSGEWYPEFLEVLNQAAAFEDAIGVPSLEPTGGVSVELNGQTLRGIWPSVASDLADPAWEDVLLAMAELQAVDGPIHSCGIHTGPVVECVRLGEDPSPEAVAAADHLRTLVEDLGGTLDAGSGHR